MEQSIPQTEPTSPSDHLAFVCKAVADPLRLDILRVLSHDSFGVLELASIFGLPQPGMSHHLKVLARAGLVLTRRQGNIIFYRRTLVKSGLPFAPLLTSLYRTIDDLLPSQEVTGRMRKVYDDRAYASKLYFERNVDQFSQNQGLLCEIDQYLTNLNEILDIMRLPFQSHVMEVGPGQGGLLIELARRYDHLVALDSSEEMLNLTRLSMTKQNKVKFINCALEDYDPGVTAFDALVLNMVLHHLPSPSHAFQKSRQILKPHGFLVIADLCLHHQEWTRTSCGDVWLGFDPQDLDEWAKQAGFLEKESLYLGLKNGFQIQIKLFQTIESRDLTL